MRGSLTLWRTILLPLGMAGLCAVMVIWSGRWGLAEFYTFPIEKLSTKLHDPKVSFEEKESAWQQAVHYNRQALSLHPGNAEYWLQLGQLHYVWSRQIKEDIERSASLLAEAASNYEMAANIRPTWGYTWINLAQVRMVQGRERWGEAVTDLERAMVLAPWEPTVQQNVVRLGFILWSVLEDRLQNDVLNVAVRAMQSSPYPILELVQRYGKREQIQHLVRRHARLRIEFDKYFETISQGADRSVDGRQR
ncbi:MAG: hypothetical protein HQL66_04000 [Magnetococcales bacterium]|nr:hypothetical protein [Magnetococcales bacterium]